MTNPAGEKWQLYSSKLHRFMFIFPAALRPSAEELHSRLISNYTSNNRELWSRVGVEYDKRKGSVMANGRVADRATRSGKHTVSIFTVFELEKVRDIKSV